jgi:hypothetical protein
MLISEKQRKQIVGHISFCRDKIMMLLLGMTNRRGMPTLKGELPFVEQ